MAVPAARSGVNEPQPGVPAQLPAGPDGRPPEGASSTSTNMGAFGMAAFLVALGVLFTASLVAYLLIRLRSETWPPPNAPRLPAGLWLSTMVIVLCSATIHWAHRGIVAGRQSSLLAAMIVTFLLGVLFLANQTLCWFAMAAAYEGAPMDLHAFTFYMLTTLHAAHVIGGLILLIVVTVKAFAGRYTPSYHPGVRYSAMYWHFLDAVWLVLFTMIYVAG